MTNWREDGQPAGLFGPDGPGWSSAQELLGAMADALALGELETRAALASENTSGTVIGWIRIFGSDAESAVASDLRVELRSDGGSWVVAAVDSRVHCVIPLEDGDCPR